MTKHPGAHNERSGCFFCLFLQDFFCCLVNWFFQVFRRLGAGLDSAKQFLAEFKCCVLR